MTAASLQDWVARDDAAYVAKAVAVAQDRAALLQLKRGLRARLLAQPSWDAHRYAKDFGEALQEMWRETFR